MGYPINPPPYPVIEREPSMSQVLASFRRGDWGNVVLATGLSAPFGYYAGRPVLMVRSMWFASGIGLLGGVFVGLQRSFGRLTGYQENGEEVARVHHRITGSAETRISEPN